MSVSKFHRRLASGLMALWLTAGVAIVTIVVSSTPAAATGPTVNGAGSTWVQIALDQWRADYGRQGYTINYQGVGSSAGREFYIIGQVDFAASEIPFQPDEVQELHDKHRSYQYLPDVAGGTSLMYNLHTTSGQRVRNLRLDANTAGGIFTGKITSWQDPAIQALNPGLDVRDTTITPVIRSDGAGTSAQLSLYLANQAPSVWNAFVQRYGCPAPCSEWHQFPGSIGQRGSEGVANFVSNDALGQGSIGYVEAGYAFDVGFPVGSLHNKTGNYAQPTAGNVASALRHATLNQDLTQDLTGVYNAPEANAYPMSSYSYMITPTAGFDPAKGNVLGGWIIYIACAGQQKAASLGYSPLPPNLIKADFDAVNRIPGHPATPPIDYAHCPNPNLPHDGGGGDGNSTTPPSGGDSTTAPGDGSTSAPAAGTTVPAGTLPPGEGDTSEFGTQPLPAGVEVTTLDTAGQQAAFEAGLKNAAYAEPKPALPLVVAALSVLLVVFLPVVLEVRRSPRTTKTIQVDRPPTGPTNTGPTDAGSAGAGPEGIGDADDR